MRKTLVTTSICLILVCIHIHDVIGSQKARSHRIPVNSDKKIVQYTQDNDPLSRIRFYFEQRFDKVQWSVNVQKTQWVDFQVKRFLEDIKTELDSLMIVYSSLGEECETLQKSPQGSFDRNAVSNFSASIVKLESKTKALREKLSDSLFWSGQVKGFKLDSKIDSGEKLGIAVQLLNNLFSEADTELRNWLFPEIHQDSSVVTVQEALEGTPMIKLMKAELVAGEITRNLRD